MHSSLVKLAWVAVVGAGLVLALGGGTPASGQDHNDSNQFLWAGKNVYIPIVPNYTPKVGDKLFARDTAVGYPTRDEFVARWNAFAAPVFPAKEWHDRSKPHKLDVLDRMRVVETYPPDPRLVAFVKDHRCILVKIETGRLRGQYRIVGDGDVALPTVAGRAMIKD